MLGTPTRYITLHQLSVKLGGRSRSSIYRDLEHNRLPSPMKLGHRLYWDEAEVEAVIAESRISN